METFGHWVSLHYARVETVPWKQAENAQQRLKLNPADSFSSTPKSSKWEKGSAIEWIELFLYSKAFLTTSIGLRRSKLKKKL